jgi:hypothetical protein
MTGQRQNEPETVPYVVIVGKGFGGLATMDVFFVHQSLYER